MSARMTSSAEPFFNSRSRMRFRTAVIAICRYSTYKATPRFAPRGTRVAPGTRVCAARRTWRLRRVFSRIQRACECAQVRGDARGRTAEPSRGVKGAEPDERSESCEAQSVESEVYLIGSTDREGALHAGHSFNGRPP